MENHRHIAIIQGPVGLKGDVKLRPNNDSPDWVGQLSKVVFRTPDGTAHTLTVTYMSEKKTNEIWVRFEGYADRTALEKAGLTKGQLWVADTEMPELDTGEFYMDQLPGLKVVSQGAQKPIATVSEWLNSSGEDFLELKALDEQAPYTIVVPFVEHFFPSVDVAAGQVVASEIAVEFICDAFEDERRVAEERAAKKEQRIQKAVHRHKKSATNNAPKGNLA